jgi:hypothetical protein
MVNGKNQIAAGNPTAAVTITFSPTRDNQSTYCVRAPDVQAGWQIVTALVLLMYVALRSP